MSLDEKVTYFAETDFRNKKTKFGIKAKDRTRHVYVMGKTGMGKSTLLENMAIQDILGGEGVAFIDPHGGTAEKLLDYIPEHRIADTIYFAPFDADYPISFNVLEDVGPEKRHLVASGLMNAFKKIWVDAWSARMEYILNNTMLALLECPGSTILGVNRMLTDKEYRNFVVSHVKDSGVKAFWVNEFAKYGERYMQEAGAAIQNKVGQFVTNPMIRNLIGQKTSSFDLREVMDQRKIIILNLSKGLMGEDNASLIGNMLVTKIYLGAMSRADKGLDEIAKLPPFYFYVDEFQSFANDSFAQILSESRKYRLALTIANQYVAQMPETVSDAVFGNVGTLIAFRVGAPDAEVFEKEFSSKFMADEIVSLGFAQIYLRLMIDGVGSKPFSAVTLPSIQKPARSFKAEIIAESRRRYAKEKSKVVEEIESFYRESAESKAGERTGDKPREKFGDRAGGKAGDGVITTNAPSKMPASASNQKSFSNQKSSPASQKEILPKSQLDEGADIEERDFKHRDFRQKEAKDVRASTETETDKLRENFLARKNFEKQGISEHRAKVREETHHQAGLTITKDGRPFEESKKETKNSLREALAKAITEHEEQKKFSTEKKKDDDVFSGQTKNINQAGQVKKNQNDFSDSSSKENLANEKESVSEVPEDVLRKILS